MVEAKCASSISSMEFLSSTLPQCVALASEEIMSGSLRNSMGAKVMVCLVNKAMSVGRQVSRPGIGKVVQVYREPIPTTNLDEHIKGKWVATIHKVQTSQPDGPAFAKSTVKTSPKSLSEKTEQSPEETARRTGEPACLISASKLVSTPKVKSNPKLMSMS